MWVGGWVVGGHGTGEPFAAISRDSLPNPPTPAGERLNFSLQFFNANIVYIVLDILRYFEILVLQKYNKSIVRVL